MAHDTVTEAFIEASVRMVKLGEEMRLLGERMHATAALADARGKLLAPEHNTLEGRHALVVEAAERAGFGEGTPAREEIDGSFRQVEALLEAQQGNDAH